MYCLEAVIAAEQTLIKLTSAIKEARLVSVGQNLALAHFPGRFRLAGVGVGSARGWRRSGAQRDGLRP
jgi:hypothetical protein